MKPIIKPCSFIFGVPAVLPVIPGFKVLAAQNEWLTAEQGGKHFAVEIKRRGFRLFPHAHRWDSSPVGRHAVNVLRFDQAIFIPAADAR